MITRSRLAHEGGHAREIAQAAAQVKHRRTMGDLCQLLGAGSCLQADELHTAQAGQGSKLLQRYRAHGILAMIRIALPADADFDPRVLAELAAQCSPARDRQRGRATGGQRGERNPENRRQTQQGCLDITITWGQRSPKRDNSIDAGTFMKNPQQRPRTRQHDPAASCLHERCEADELHRIPEALLGVKQDGSSMQR